MSSAAGVESSTIAIRSAVFGVSGAARVTIRIADVASATLGMWAEVRSR